MYLLFALPRRWRYEAHTLRELPYIYIYVRAIASEVSGINEETAQRGLGADRPIQMAHCLNNYYDYL